jgi:branched-chain amino acid aminotransferase
MLVAHFEAGAWRQVSIQPFGPLPLPPSISALQYGLSVFDALKAYRTVHDEIVLFRPHEHAERLRRSCRRLVLPEVPDEICLDGLKQLVQLDRQWLPGPDDGALYIRMCVFASDPSIRVRPPETCIFAIFTCPVGQYYAQPLRLLATTDYVRAFRGGTGDVKPAGNYGPSLLAEREAQRRGYHSVLWLDAQEQRYVEEAGVMNLFFVIDETVVTPALSGTILPGITRDTVISVLGDMGIRVEQRPIALDELAQAHARGGLRECFGTGTAATVTHVSSIGFNRQELELPPVAQRRIGPAVAEEIARVRTGRSPDRHAWLVRL